MIETTAKFKEAVFEQRTAKAHKPSKATAKMRVEILHNMCVTICDKHRRKLQPHEK